jgi:hypothetical protein
MRQASTKVSIFVIVISMIASSAWADPLAAGKPAGLRAAQTDSGTEWMVFGGIGALAAGILIATSGGRSSNAQGLPITVVATSATAT